MSRLLDGRVAVVTGGGRGIGRSLALGLADLGARVVVNDLGVTPEGGATQEGPAFDVADEIRRSGGEAVAETSSVATMEGGRRIVGAALEHFGRVDVLANVAGIFRHNLIYEMPEADWDAVLAVHLKGHFACIQAALPTMRRQQYGRILNFSSGVAANGLAAAANYGTAKGAIIGLTRAIAQELTSEGISAVAIAPAAETRVTVDYAQRAQALRRGTADAGPRHALPSAEQIVPALAYLSGEDAIRFSGELFHLSGQLVQAAGSEHIRRSVTTVGPWTSESIAIAVQRCLLVDVVSPGMSA